MLYKGVDYLLSKYLIDNHNIFDKSIILFPFAGGGSNIYKNWISSFQDFNVLRILYPGRESRFGEQPLTSIDTLVNEIYEEMLEEFNFDNNYYLFGHSMGTKVVYELALKIKYNEALLNPKGIIISAGKAPCFKEEKPIFHLDEVDFIEGLKSYGGTPKEVLENKDLIGMFLPMLRADFLIDEGYQDEQFKKLDTPILALMGTHDTKVELEELLEWRNYTNSEFKYDYVNGGHMFVKDNPDEVILKVKEYLNALQNE